jgi:hypothetical protein
MIRLIFLAWLTLVAPAMAQNQPVRIVNSNAVTATGLFMRAVGQEEWGENLLGRLFLPPGAFFSVQLGDGGGCRFDVRLVLRDGRSTLRRNVDLCTQRVVPLAVGGPAPPPQLDTAPE